MWDTTKRDARRGGWRSGRSEDDGEEAQTAPFSILGALPPAFPSLSLAQSPSGRGSLPYTQSVLSSRRVRKVLTAAEMREVDRLTTERYAVPSLLLMESAAAAAAREILPLLPKGTEAPDILVLCGRGNNGGDGAALARQLCLLGAAKEDDIHARARSPEHASERRAVAAVIAAPAEDENCFSPEVV